MFVVTLHIFPAFSVVSDLLAFSFRSLFGWLFVCFPMVCCGSVRGFVFYAVLSLLRIRRCLWLSRNVFYYFFSSFTSLCSWIGDYWLCLVVAINFCRFSSSMVFQAIFYLCVNWQIWLYFSVAFRKLRIFMGVRCATCLWATVPGSLRPPLFYCSCRCFSFTF